MDLHKPVIILIQETMECQKFIAEISNSLKEWEFLGLHLVDQFGGFAN